VYTLRMTTTFVQVKEFRQNMAFYADRAKKKATKERIVVMNRTTPLFELKPFSENATLDTLFADIQEARKDIKKKRVYSHDAVLRALQ
jgi:hypothetical protein